MVGPRRLVKIARNAVRDARYGGLLSGTVSTPYEHLGAFDTANSDYDDLPALFAAAAVTAEDMIVDVGCGKGRVLNWLLSRYPGNELRGIELDPDVCAKTAKRLRRYTNVQVICGDGPSLLPADATVFYLFNPFDEPVVRRFATAVLEQSVTPEDARRRIIYSRPKFVEVFREDPRFQIDPIALKSGRRAVLISVERR